jgi:signal transduction histidine kinase
MPPQQPWHTLGLIRGFPGCWLLRPMTSSVEAMDTTHEPRQLRSLFSRSTDNRVLAGVAGGIGARTGLEPDLIRAGFVVLTFAGGVGAVIYAIAWLITDAGEAEGVAPLKTQQQAAVVIMFTGVLLALRGIGVWFGDGIVFPVALFSFGVATITARRYGEDRDWLARIAGDSGGAGQARVAAGAILLVGGVTILLGSIDAIEQAGIVALAVAVTATGLFLVLGPWLFRLVNDLGVERRQRIRSDERAEVAAHLHDSVLQTLSLIQRTDDPRRMSTLARAQERELRAWLYGTGGTPGKLHASIRDHASRIEHEYNTPIEVVVVGNDAELTERTRALVQATGEAITNAARHSQSERVSVFAERTADDIEVFVTDQGVGFDPSQIGSDRHGIESSIIGRMERSGGGAEVTSTPGSGTEVRLWTKQ